MINNKKIIIKSIYKAFTLPEVIVATFISSILLSFIFVFLSNISTGILEVKKEIGIMSHLYDFSYKLNNYRNIYTSGAIIIDNTSTGSDVFVMRDSAGENGMLMGVVRLEDNKLYTDNTTYEDMGVGFRKLTAQDLSDLDSDPIFAYDYIFQDDQIFQGIKIQDLILVPYNSGSIFDLNLIVNMDFKNSLVGQYWADLPRDTLKKFNIDF